jgi:hypothetical protein
MTARYLIVAMSILPLTACDYSQKKPQTAAAAQDIAVHAPATAAWADEDSTPERSLRLIGPGVSREKQTRL